MSLTTVAPPARRAPDRPRHHMPQLDGLRTVAVVLVLVYHVLRTEEIHLLSGAFVGVDVFFVLSGFLITSLLLREHASTGRIDLRRFYVRRLWRLYPALLLVSAVAAAAFAFAPERFGLAGGSPLEALVALSYGMSWWSGLELPGGPYLLGLTWSLSVEEHFYLLWPLALLAVLRRGGGVRAVAVIAVLANAWTAGLWLLGADPDRLYYLPDARFAQLLTGCVLAAALHRAPDLGRHRWVVGPRMALLAAGGIGVVVLVATRYDGWYWSGGMQAVGLAAAVLIGHLALHGTGPLARCLSWGPLPLLGAWSYGIYLWHLPLIRLVRPLLGETLLVTGAAALLAVPLAAASYHLVEQPLLRLHARRTAAAKTDQREAAEPVPSAKPALVPVAVPTSPAPARLRVALPSRELVYAGRADRPHYPDPRRTDGRGTSAVGARPATRPVRPHDDRPPGRRPGSQRRPEQPEQRDAGATGERHRR